MKLLSRTLLVLVLGTFWSCGAFKFRPDTDLLGLLGPVAQVDIFLEGSLSESWTFDEIGRFTSRNVVGVPGTQGPLGTGFFFHHLFASSTPGREDFHYQKDGSLESITRPGETEWFYTRPGDRLTEAVRKDAKGTVLSIRSYERDYKGNLLAMKFLTADRKLLSFYRVETYKTSRPAEITVSLPEPEGTLKKVSQVIFSKDGLLQSSQDLTRDPVSTKIYNSGTPRTLDPQGNWISAPLEGLGTLTRTITYHKDSK